MNGQKKKSKLVNLFLFNYLVLSNFDYNINIEV